MPKPTLTHPDKITNYLVARDGPTIYIEVECSSEDLAEVIETTVRRGLEAGGFQLTVETEPQA